MEPLRSVAHRVLRHQQLETLDGGLRDSQATGRPVVLVVEDHIDVARVVGRTLEQDYEVHYAGDGEQGLAKAGELTPDLIITDVKMPQMNGIDFCSQLRQAAWSCNIPVIMLSARIGEKDRIRGIKAGADAYLVKPFVREELRAWVSRLIESRRVMREAFAGGQPVESPRVTSAENRDAADAHFLAEFARQVEKQMSSGSKLDFDRIALSFKMGETQLRRKIQTLTGKNVPAYVTQLRMEKAMRLLRDNPDSLIGDIAEQCGFQDVAYFSRVFRQHYGMAPSQVRDAGK
jgi:DNA-binding response OmpR family regulator